MAPEQPPGRPVRELGTIGDGRDLVALFEQCKLHRDMEIALED
jgi:hypothetical protein